VRKDRCFAKKQESSPALLVVVHFERRADSGARARLSSEAAARALPLQLDRRYRVIRGARGAAWPERAGGGEQRAESDMHSGARRARRRSAWRRSRVGWSESGGAQPDNSTVTRSDAIQGY
jgi:hypothetical protein